MKAEQKQRELVEAQEELRRLQLRSGLANFEPWVDMQLGFRDYLDRIEKALLSPPEDDTLSADLEMRRIRLLQGQRQVIVGLLFTDAEVARGIETLQAKIQGLRDELHQWESIGRHPPP